MIRALLTDLFPSRAAVGELRQRVRELESEVLSLTHERDGAIAVLALRENENAALQKRALRPDPTPSEARMLEIVRGNPGMTAPDLGVLCLRGEHPSMTPATHGEVFYAYLTNESAHLTALHKKNLVRRERSGNTYRYWVNE